MTTAAGKASLAAAGLAGLGWAAHAAAKRGLAHRNAPGNPLNWKRLAVTDKLEKRALEAFTRAENRLKSELGDVKRVFALRAARWLSLPQRNQWVQHTVFTPAAREACMKFWVWVYSIVDEFQIVISSNGGSNRASGYRHIDELLYRLMRRALQIAREERDGLPNFIPEHRPANGTGWFFWRITQNHVARAKRDIVAQHLKQRSN